MLAQIVEGRGEFTLDMVMDRARDVDFPRVAQSLQPGGDIHPVAVDVVSFHNHVTQVDAHPELDPAVLWHVCIVVIHRPLNTERVADGVDRAGEFNKHAITRDFDDAPAIGSDLGVDEVRLQRPEARARPFLVGLNQPAVADHIGNEDRRKPPLDALFGHRDRFPQSGVVVEILCVSGGHVHRGRMVAVEG
ncbi:MAG: hypothetical protein V3R30_05940, partial [Kiloniellales bacterium]